MSDINVNAGQDKVSECDWKKYQKTDAKQAAIENNLQTSNGSIVAMMFAGTDTAIAKELTNICDQMSETYDLALADEVEYEIEEQTRTVEEIKKELKEVQDRIKELSAKQENGTITEEEQEELNGLQGKTNDLKAELQDAIADELFMAHGFEEELNEQKTVRETALEYSDTAIDVGEDVVEDYQDKAERFFARIFGKTYDEQIEIGNNAIKSGINLEAVVKTADQMTSIAEGAVDEATAAADDAQGAVDDATETPQASDSDKDDDKKDDKK